MAAVGVAASIVTLAQTAKDLYELMKSVEGAPTYILDVTEDVRVLKSVTEQIEYDEHASPTQLASAVEVLALCKLKLQKLELLLGDLGLHTSSKRRRTWGSIKAVWRKEKIEALRKSLESAKTTLIMARGVFAEQATKREVALLTKGMNNIRTHQATRNSVSTVAEHMGRVQEKLAYQQDSINTIIASQRDVEQHVTKVHFDINQAVQRFCSTSDSLAQPFIRNSLKHSVIEIAQEAIQDPAMRRELSKIVSTPQETASECLMPTSSNDNSERLNRPASATATNNLGCYNPSRAPFPRKRYGKRSVLQNFKWYKTIVGTVSYTTKIVHRQSYEDVSENSTWHELETIFTIIPAPWLMRFGFELVSTKMFDARSHSLRTFRTVPNDALIFDFCHDGNVAGIRSLIQRGLASPFDRDEEGRTPLHWATLRGRYDVCAMLIHAGAPVDATEYRFGVSPFLMFSRYYPAKSEIERITITRLFIEEGKIDLTLTDHSGRNAFHRGNWHLEWLLRNEGLLFDPLQKDQFGCTALMFACWFPRDPKDLKMLIEAGSDVNTTDVCGQDAMDFCLESDRDDAQQTAKLKVLLQAGAKHHMRAYWSHTHTSRALLKPQKFRFWRDALLSLDDFDLTNFLNAELENGMPLWREGWTIHSLCGIFLAPPEDLERLDGISRLEEKNFLDEEFRRGWGLENLEGNVNLEGEFRRQCRTQRGNLWVQWERINPWVHYLNDIKERMRYECYLPHLGIVPKRKVPLVFPKPRRYLTLRKSWDQSLRRMRWNVYQSLPESLREYRVCTLPPVVDS